MPQKLPGCHRHTIVRLFLLLPTSETGCIFWCHQSVEINQGTLWGKKTKCLVDINGKCSSHVLHIQDTLLALFSLTAISRRNRKQRNAKEAGYHS